MRQLYFDYNATTPIAVSVREAMLPFLSDRFGSPASHYPLGRAAAEAVEDARGQVAGLLGCDAEEIVFTSGGSESNNLAIKGLAFRKGLAAGGHLVISAVEHASVAEPARFLERMGFDVSVVPCTGQGVVQPAAVRRALRSDTLLVSVMLANDETGVIQPLKQIAEICRDAGVLLHSDAVQAVGRIRVSVPELDVDLLSLSAHKMHGPAGTGALFIRQGIDLESLVHGEGQEAGLRAGREHVAGIVGLGAAAQLAAKSLEKSQERTERLRDRLASGLQAVLGDRLIIHGQMAERLPQTLCVGFPNVSGQAMLAHVPELCAATCASRHHEMREASPTLAAMGVAAEVAQGTIRLSLGWYTTEEEVDRAASLLIGAWDSCQGG